MMIGKINSSENYRLNLPNNSNIKKPCTTEPAVNTSGNIDVFSISRISQEIKQLSAITSVNGKSVADLKAINNVLTVTKNAYYRISLFTGLKMIWSPDAMLWEDLKSETGLKTLEPETIGVFGDMYSFIAALCQGHGSTIRQFVTEGKALDYYASLGIKTGAWAEVNSPWRSGPFYITDDGIPFSEEEIENVRMLWNTRDNRLEGCTEDSVLVVNGKEYKMDENGHFNIPKGEPVIWYKDMIIPPKEMAEWRRAQTTKPLEERGEGVNTW
jgi:hypothetical protein